VRRLSALACLGLALGGALAACVGAGEGRATGPVHVPMCQINRTMDWPLNFFAADRTGRMLQIRAQYGGAVSEFTDHLFFRIDDTVELTRRIQASTEVDAMGRKQLTVQVGPIGAPGVLVHGYLALRWSCGRTKTTRLGQNVSLPAVSGTMVFRSVDNGWDDPQRVTDVPSFALTFRDDRPVGDPPPTGLSPTDPIGDATMSGSFRFVYDTAVPAQGFPGP
jgi:hypothetical protein